MKLLYIAPFCLGLVSCGEKTAEKISQLGNENIEEMENQYGPEGDLLPEAPNTNVSVTFGDYNNQTFDKVYRYQANVSDSETFIWMTFDNNDSNDQHIAVTLSLRGITKEGEYTLDRQKNGDIYIEMDQKAFRSDAGNAFVKLSSVSGEYMEGTFSVKNASRTQNKSEEKIDIIEAKFKLPLKDMRRKK